MRRNAESLLILAGSGPARQWSAAVPAMDVARAASAEVEDYKRLRLHHFDPAMMTGAVTTDLVHIMAELVENALTFSPPGSPVDVYGRFLEGGYVIVIVDSGIGMSAEDLDLANHRLGGEGSESEVPGRYLGHFVAGRLAARHGIAISLQSSHSGGLVARVKIPASLIEEPVPDLSAVAEVRSALPPSYEPAAPAPPTPFEDRVFESPFVPLTADEVDSRDDFGSRSEFGSRDDFGGREEAESPAEASALFEAPSPFGTLPGFQEPSTFEDLPVFEAPAAFEPPPAFDAPAAFDPPPALDAPVVFETPSVFEAPAAAEAAEAAGVPGAPHAFEDAPPHAFEAASVLEAPDVPETPAAFEAPATVEPVPVLEAPAVAEARSVEAQSVEAQSVAEAPPAFEAPVAHEPHAAYETPAVFEALANFEAARRSPEPAPPVGSATPPADPFFASAFGPPALASRFGQQPDEEVAAAQGVDEVVAEAPPSTGTSSNFEVGGEFGYRAEEDYDAAVSVEASDDKQSGYLPAWAGEISDPAWDYGETEPDEDAAQLTSASGTAAAPTIAPFDWAAPVAAPQPAGSNGSSSAAPTTPVVPAAPVAPAPDAWDPMVTQRSASNSFDSEPSTPAPPGAAPAKPSWLSSIDHGVSIASTIPPPDPGAWAPAAPAAPQSGKGPSEVNPASFTPRSPAEISPASFAPKTPDLGVASPLVTGAHR